MPSGRSTRHPASTILVTYTRARRVAPIPDPFSFFSSAARTESTAPRLEALAEPTVPPARLDANGAAAAAELRGGCRRPPAPPLRRDDGVNHSCHLHARARRVAPIPDPFSFFSSAARTESTAPRLEALAEPTVPPARLDANGAAAAAELRGGCRRPPAPPLRRNSAFH